VNRRKADAALAGNTVVWGATFVLVKAALDDVSPLVFLALRFALATAALLVLFRGARVGSWAEMRAGALAGTFLFCGYLLQTVGLEFTSAPKSAFITGLTSVMVPLLGILVYRVRPQASELLGVVIAIAGLGLLTMEGPIATASMNRGDVLTIGCTVAYAAHILTLGHYAGKVRFEALAVTQVGTAGLLAGSLFWWAEAPRLVWRLPLVAAVVITGLIATAAAFTVQAWAQKYTTSTRTALIYMLEPVFAWITSYVIAGVGLSGRAAAGAALILGGVLVVEMKPLNPRLHPLP